MVNLEIKADHAPEIGTQLWTVTFGTYGRSRVLLVVRNIVLGFMTWSVIHKNGGASVAKSRYDPVDPHVYIETETQF